MEGSRLFKHLEQQQVAACELSHLLFVIDLVKLHSLTHVLRDATALIVHEHVITITKQNSTLEIIDSLPVTNDQATRFTCKSRSALTTVLLRHLYNKLTDSDFTKIENDPSPSSLASMTMMADAIDDPRYYQAYLWNQKNVELCVDSEDEETIELRAGDIIEYYGDNFGFGNPDGFKKRQIREIEGTGGDIKVTMANNDVLDYMTMVRRVSPHDGKHWKHFWGLQYVRVLPPTKGLIVLNPDAKLMAEICKKQVSDKLESLRDSSE